MSSDGGGGNPIDDLAKHPLGAIANAAVNFSTFGMSGVDPSTGKFNIKGGVYGHAIDEGLGEITGRNIAREQAGIAQHKTELEDAARGKDLKDRQTQEMNNDINASNQIAALRGTAAARSNPALRYNSLGGSDTKDFLGL